MGKQGQTTCNLTKEVTPMIQPIAGEDNFKKTVLEAKSPVMVDFWAQWCGPCLATAPILEELAKEYAGKIDFAKVDVDANGPLAARYGIASIPTMIVFIGGQPVQQFIGYRSKKELKKVLDCVLEG
jgi:thioredoxin 1